MEGRRKPAPDGLSALLQRMLMQLLSAAATSPEVHSTSKQGGIGSVDPTLRVFSEGDERYPTRLSLVIEIRSEGQAKELIEKRRNYDQAGVSHIFVLDPAAQVIYRCEKDLVETQDLEFAGRESYCGHCDLARTADSQIETQNDDLIRAPCCKKGR